MDWRDEPLTIPGGAYVDLIYALRDAARLLEYCQQHHHQRMSTPMYNDMTKRRAQIGVVLATEQERMKKVREGSDDTSEH